MKPFIWFISFIFEGALSITESAGLSLVLLSLFVTLVLIPVLYLAERFKKRNLLVKEKMKTVEEEIERAYTGHTKYLYLKTLYRQHGYNPLNNFIPLIIPLFQIPFFLAAYKYLSLQNIFIGKSFFILKDLSQPDQLLTFAGLSLNLLPLLMTIINLINVEVTSLEKPSDKVILRYMAFVFLGILYFMPSSLVFYWMMNNFFNLLVSFFRFGFKDFLRNISLGGKNIFQEFGKISALSYELGFITLFISIYFFILNWLNVTPNSNLEKNSLVAGLFCLVLSGLFFIRGFLSRNSIKKIHTFDLKVSTLCMLCILPIIHYADANITFLNNKYIYEILIYLILPTFLILFVLNKILNLFLKNNLILIFVGGLFLTFYLSPMWLYLFKSTIEEGFSYLILLMMVVFVILLHFYKSKRKFFESLVLILLVFALGRFSIKYFKRQLAFLKVNKEIKLPNYLNQKAQLKPSVYLLVYDAYIDQNMTKHFGVDNQAQMKYLKDQNFKIYKNMLTLHAFSLGSDSGSYNLGKIPSNKTQMRRILVGLNPVDRWLKNNGYKITYFANDYFFQEEKEVAVSEVIVPNKSVNVLLKGIIQGEFKFETISSGFKYDHWRKIKSEILNRKEATPRFFHTHSRFPGHTQNSGRCLVDEIERFKDRLATANQEMREDIETILKNDPYSIIITAGDHGVYLTGDCTQMKSYSTDQITGEHILDRYGVHLAIRWPDEKYKGFDDIRYLQGIFSSVISYMTQNPEPLKHQGDGKICLRGVCASNSDPISDGPDKGLMLFDSLKKSKNKTQNL